MWRNRNATAGPRHGRSPPRPRPRSLALAPPAAPRPRSRRPRRRHRDRRRPRSSSATASRPSATSSIPTDFAHFDYVNPDAPQGGTMSFRGTGASQTFDSLNAFILKGEPAQGLGLLYDSLLAGSADEPDAAYGLIAESLEYPRRPLLGDLQHAPRGDLLRRRRRSPPRTWSSPGRCCSRRARPPTRSSSRTSRPSRRSTRTASSSPSSPAPPSATCRRSPAASRSCRSTTTRPSSSASRR